MFSDRLFTQFDQNVAEAGHQKLEIGVDLIEADTDSFFVAERSHFSGLFEEKGERVEKLKDSVYFSVDASIAFGRAGKLDRDLGSKRFFHHLGQKEAGGFQKRTSNFRKYNSCKVSLLDWNNCREQGHDGESCFMMKPG